MHPVDSPSELSPDQRLQEIARILANGLLRLHGERGNSNQFSAEIPPEAGPRGLEVSGTSMLTVTPR